jgi:hypothetical protein
MPLPTEKRQPQPGLGKILVHAFPKVGKTSTVAAMYPEETLILDAEGSTTAIEAYVQPVHGWVDFLQAGADLKAESHAFHTVQVDTVDVLARMCADHAITNLAGGAAATSGRNEGKRFVHASDFDYGKGWDAVLSEFQLRVAKLATLVPNIVFISHADETTIKDRAGERTVIRPDVKPKGVRAWLEGFVDHILYMEVVTTPEGKSRVIRTQPSDAYQAGGRTPAGLSLPDPLVLGDSPQEGGRVLREALESLVVGEKAAA